MGRLPELTYLIYFAIAGVIAVCGTALGLAIWLGYHLVRALVLYLGG